MKSNFRARLLVCFLPLLLTQCGKQGMSEVEYDPSAQERTDLTSQAMMALSSVPENSVHTTQSPDEAIGDLLMMAVPNASSIKLSKISSNVRAARYYEGMTPGGLYYQARGGKYYSAYGDVAFGGRVGAYNPYTGNAAAAGGIWIPGLGAAGYGVAYIPGKGYALTIGGISPNGAGGVVCTTANGCVKKGVSF